MCVSPISVRLKRPIFDASGNMQYDLGVPCGYCHECQTNWVKQWQVRILLEARAHKYNYFVTLTYSSENVPIAVSNDEFYLTLVANDLLRWIKKLRKKRFLRYFAIGEYGSHTQRPHYHAIIFTDEVLKPLDIQKSWSKGLIRMDPLNPARAAYTAKYHTKGLDNRPHPLSAPPFRLMSRMPGLGSYYAKEDSEVTRWHKETLDHAYIRISGIKYPLPNYLKRQMYDKLDLRKAAQQAPDLSDKINEDYEASYQKWKQYHVKKGHDVILKRKGKL